MKIRILPFIAFFAVFFNYNIFGQNFLYISKTNNGQNITLSNDQVLELRLPRVSSAGYIWCEPLTSTEKANIQFLTKIEEADFIHDSLSGTPINGKMVGQSGLQVLRYEGSAQGTTTLNLVLRRPWENDMPPIDNFTINVVSAGKYSGNFIPPSIKTIQHPIPKSSSVPSKWDWRPQCTPIANQQSCGDCWAFAGVGTFECNIKIIDGVTRDISEEYLTNCYTDNGCIGCNGGYCPHGAWLASYGGAVYESEDPWTSSEGAGNTGTCGGPYAFHETIDSYSDVSGQDAYGVPPDANLKEAIYNYGPIWVGVNASSTAWSYYTGGIFTENGSYNVDHAVVLVGWVDSASVAGGGYWIVRNSWGANWGIKGYMYLSYGSDYIGCEADYIVYKGGISHAVPPIVSFEASNTSSCSGDVQFTDNSTNNPTSWLWKFGDKKTSALQNPLHTYTNNGTFNVTLVAKNKYGVDSLSMSSYITINMPESPTATGASCTAPCSVTLSASGYGTLYWYNAATGGNILDSGNTYTTPVLKDTATYYVQSKVAQSARSEGMSANTSNGGYYTSIDGWALIFNALSNVTINSVTVYSSATASRCIWLKNSNGTILDSVTTTIASGKQSVTLNFNVIAGTGYLLGTDANCQLWRDKSGATYPYTTAGLVSITGNTAGSTATNYYYYFYNWQVQPMPCFSPRVPVFADIKAYVGINEKSVSDFEIFPNPNNGNFEIKLNNTYYQNVTFSLINLLGQTLLQEKVTSNDFPLQVDASGFKDGLYYVKVQTDKSTYLRKIIIYKK